MTPCRTCVYCEPDKPDFVLQAPMWCTRRDCPVNDIEWSEPCKYYIEDARCYKERTEIKPNKKRKKK